MRTGPLPLPCPAWSAGQRRAAGSRRPVPVTAAAFPVGDEGEGVDGGTRIGVRVEAPAAFGAYSPSLAQQQRATEQVGPDFHPVEPELVQLGADTDKRGGFREQRQLDGGRSGQGFRAPEHDLAGSVSPGAQRYEREAAGDDGPGRGLLHSWPERVLLQILRAA